MVLFLNGFLWNITCKLYRIVMPYFYGVVWHSVIDRLGNPPRCHYIQKTTTIRYGLWAGRIIGPYFFKNDADQNVTLNGTHYYRATDNGLFAAICCFGEVDFTFRNRLGHAILHLGTIFFRSHIKSRVYMTMPITVEELEVGIVERIPLETLERVMENWKFRLDHVSQIRPKFKEIWFKNNCE